MNSFEILFAGALMLATAGARGASVDVGADTELATVIGEPDPLIQAQKMTVYMASLKPDAMPNKVRFLEASSGPGKTMALRILMSHWAAVDAAAAATESFARTDRESSETMIDAAYGAWARKDAAAAARHLQDVPRGGVIIREGDDMPLPKTAIDYRSLGLEDKRVCAIDAILGAVTETDPEKAVKLALQFQSEKPWQDGFYLVFRRWTRTDLAGATKALASLDKDHAGMAIQSIAQSLVWMDPKSALAWIEQLPDGRARRDARNEVIRDWVQQDPKAVIEYLQKDLPSGDRTALVQGAIDGWSVIDPKGTAEWLRQQPRTTRNDMALEEAVIAWSGTDSKAAVAYIQKLPSAQQRNKFLGDVLSNWLKVDPDGAEKWFNSQPHDRGLASSFEYWLAQHDPARAVGQIESLPAGFEKDEALGYAINTWSDQDPDAAWAWALKLPDSDLKTSTLCSVLASMAFHEAFKAMARLDSLPSGVMKDRCTASLAGMMVDVDSNLAIKLYDRLPTATRQNDLAGMAFNWGEFDAKSAVLYGSAQLTGGARSSYLTTGLGEWFQQDPNAASAWLQQLPRNPDNLDVVRHSFECWFSNDEKAATEFLLSLPAGKDRADMINDHVYAVVQTNPVKGLEWIKQLSASDAPHDREIQFFRLWLSENEVTAKEALANSDLTATERQSLSAH